MSVVAKRREVADALLVHARRVSDEGVVQAGCAFTDVPEADAFLRSRPEAFLIGVLFTQGIPAERAWAGPWRLSQRLGHFDLERLALETDAVSRAVATPPALHRFVKTLPKWISEAARRVVSEYGGDASAIWPHGATVAEVAERLRSFPGIGEKKAAMAVELLVRHLGVRLTGLEDGCVAYDVHVRRVFLRSGLVDRDAPGAIRDAARFVKPEDPGSVDLATWLIGRQFCRPTVPRCDACPLVSACPRLVWIRPEGVGVRR
ncbi:MAG: hypothetical protein QMD76_08130 [Anaerosomatales bacterium]|nr:hypothetical protein [Anaerosomatales bacterium]GAV31576.1 predicted EndoIII-related endonuclease [Coriobacteriaceae bacterium EMTCatB1]